MDPVNLAREEKHCPFSLSFGVPVKKNAIASPGQEGFTVKIGFPCIKEQCKIYSKIALDCNVNVIAIKLTEFVEAVEKIT